MHTNEELKQDLDRVNELIDSLKLKYGPDFCCIFAAGVGINIKVTNEDEPDAYSGCARIIGGNNLLHQACHSLLDSARFVDNLINAFKCIIRKNNNSKFKNPEFMNMLMQESMDSLKNILFTQTKEFIKMSEEMEVQEAVDQLLKNSGFKN